MNKTIITNNYFVYQRFREKIDVQFHTDYTYIEILQLVRDKVHSGHRLITHPLSGSIKPNETPFKSVVISRNKEELDFEGVSIIEESIASAEKFLKNKHTPKYSDNILNDFRLIDLSLIENAINRMLCL